MPIDITVSGNYQAAGTGKPVKQLGPTSTGWYLTLDHRGWKFVTTNGQTRDLPQLDDVITAVGEVLEVARRTGLHVAYEAGGFRPAIQEWWPPTQLPLVRTA